MNLGIRGHSVLSNPATVRERGAAWCADLAVSAGVFATVVALFPSALNAGGVGLFVLIALSAFFQWLPTRMWKGASVGEWLHGLRAKPRKLRTPLKRVRHLDGAHRTTVSILTVIVLGVAVGVFHRTYSTHPLWAQVPETVVSASVPDLGTLNVSGTERWIVAPFFYSLGAWPRTYRGQPVFFELPYEKGPPVKFFGHITARWNHPRIRLTFEGPKTPQVLFAESVSRDQVKRCLTSGTGWLDQSSGGSVGCRKLRGEVLTRHLREFQESLGAIRLGEWSLAWFSVENPGLGTQERTQGFRLRASHGDRSLIRYVFMTPKNVHQSMTLAVVQDATGDEVRYAEDLLNRAVGSLRVSDDLNAGRAWIDRQIEGIRQDDIRRLEGTEAMLGKLSEVQFNLLAQVSVDPSRFEAYFHLAGMSLKQLELAKSMGRPEWSAGARSLIASVYSFAKDVIATMAPSAQERQLARIERIWLESKKM